MSYVAFQYAEALFATADEAGQIQGLQQDYKTLLDAKDTAFTVFLNHPKVTKNEKKEVLTNVVSNTLLRHFLFVLIDNSRMDIVEDVYSELITIINNQNKLMNVVVYSKEPLTNTELENLQTNIGKKHKRTVVLTNEVDPKILGGLRIEYEGYVLDQTINEYLHSLQNKLSK